MDKSAEGGLKTLRNTMTVRKSPPEHWEQLQKSWFTRNLNNATGSTRLIRVDISGVSNINALIRDQKQFWKRSGKRECHRFNEQNNVSARALYSVVHFFAFSKQLQREMTKFNDLWRPWPHGGEFSFLSELECCPYEFISGKLHWLLWCHTTFLFTWQQLWRKLLRSSERSAIFKKSSIVHKKRIVN